MVNIIVTVFTVIHLICDVYGAPDIDAPLVETSQGSIRGMLLTTRNNRTIAAFRGIPYAEPPVGALRFHDPVPIQPWNGTLDAVQDGTECPQLQSTSVNGDEDCLYLNVYTPELGNKKRALPVMVFVHPGSYLAGNGSLPNFGPGYLLDKDVVLVVMNYRLNIFGFLSTGDEAAPGNFGLKDQTLVLEWVQKHINAFGGNPKNVTIFGDSAGGSCVNLHAFSDLSKGLFQQYITQSGSALASWAVHNASIYSTYARKVGEIYNCPVNTSLKLVACLRKLSVSQLLLASAFSPLSQMLGVTWGPTIEPNTPNAFLTKFPINLLRENKQQDIRFISGHVKDDGLLYTSQLYANDTAFKEVVTNLKSILNETISLLLPQVNATSVTDDVMEFYFNGTPSFCKDIVLPQLTDYMNDLFFLYPEWVFLKYQATQAKSPFYFYSFDYRGTFSRTSMSTGNNENLGVNHGDDEIYLTPKDPAAYKLPNLRMSETDYEMVDIMTNFWTSFARDGFPTAENLEDPDIWKSYVPNNNILQIGNNTELSVTLLQQSCKRGIEFWKKHLPL